MLVVQLKIMKGFEYLFLTENIFKKVIWKNDQPCGGLKENQRDSWVVEAHMFNPNT